MIVNIYTKDRLYLKCEAVSVTLPCTDGELCVMNGHMPLVASVMNGRLKIRTGPGDEDIKIFSIGNGFATVKNNNVMIYVNRFSNAEFRIGKSPEERTDI